MPRILPYCVISQVTSQREMKTHLEDRRSGHVLPARDCRTEINGYGAMAEL